MRLNLGCGHNKKEGWTNVDNQSECKPDILADLEKLPWMWKTSSIEAIEMNHCLEHMGQDPRLFLGIMKELYRVCKDQATVLIVVPHPRHSFYLNDPTHVRPINPDILGLFDKQNCDNWKAKKESNSPLAHYIGVDFEITFCGVTVCEPYASQMDRNEITKKDVDFMSYMLNDVLSEYQMILKVHKPARPAP